MSGRFLIGFILLLFSFNSVAQSELESILSDLDSVMLRRREFDLKRETKINALKEILNTINLNQSEIVNINSNLIKEYRTYTFDSALHYININQGIAIQLKNKLLEYKSLLEKAKLLASSGGYTDAFDILEKIDKKELDRQLITEYYSAYRKLWEDVSYYTPIGENYLRYNSIQEKYTDSLIPYISVNTDLFYDIKEKGFRDSRELDSCMFINVKRLANFEIGNPQYSLITFERSLIYELEGNQELRKKYLALSAISDIQASIKDNASLTKLATLLFNDGEIERAYRYIKFSFEDAEFFNSRLRFIEISNIFPLITAAHQQRIDNQNNKLRKLITLISFLFLILFIGAYAIFKQVGKLRIARNNLKEANSSLKLLNDDFKSANQKLESLNHSLYESDHVKNQYIGHFLAICSDYIDKLDEYRHQVKRAVLSKKYQELIDRVSSQEFIDNEVEEFYRTFDRTFLDIYPNFIEKFNNLLDSEGKIESKMGELNTELRIYALIRLGISDSSQISRLLRYSVNTIYNYRAKVKGRGIVSKEEFDEHVMRIDANKGIS